MKASLKKEIQVPFRAPLFWISGMESPLIFLYQKTKNKKQKKQEKKKKKKHMIELFSSLIE